jgi:hypothetical protein
MDPDFTVALKRVTEAVATWARDTQGPYAACWAALLH